MRFAETIKQGEEKLRSFQIPQLKKIGFLNRNDLFFPSVHYPPITMYSPIEQEGLFAGYANPQKNLFDIYVHIPFCMRHCVFCHYPVKLGNRPREKDHYLDMLEKEFDLYLRILGHKRLRVRSVLFGGGTPTYLSPAQLDRSLRILCSRLESDCKPQFSYDVDPVTLLGKEGKERLSIMRSYGVNRLTIGVQSLDNAILKIMNRPHSAADAVKAVKRTQAMGFQLNIEFIFGYPRQSFTSWIQTLQKAIALDVQEIQLYRLKVIPYGDFNGIIKKKYNITPEDFLNVEQTMLMKTIALNMLTDAGYRENLTRVFTKNPRDFSLYAHNQCCNLLDQIGLGLTAFSSLHDRFGLNTQYFDEYYSRIGSGRLPLNRGLVRNADDQLRWAIILPLKNRKVYATYYQKLTGTPLHSVFRKKIETLQSFGLVREDPSTLELTEKGRFFADEVCHQFHHPRFIPFPQEAYTDGPLSPYKNNHPL